MGKVYVTRGIFETEMCFEHKRPPIAHKGLDFNLDYMPQIIQDNFPVAAGLFSHQCPLNFRYLSTVLIALLQCQDFMHGR